MAGRIVLYCAAARETGLSPASGGPRDSSLGNPFTLTRGYVGTIHSEALLYSEARRAPIYGPAGVCRNAHIYLLEKAIPGLVQTPTRPTLIYGRKGGNDGAPAHARGGIPTNRRESCRLFRRSSCTGLCKYGSVPALAALSFGFAPVMPKLPLGFHSGQFAPCLGINRFSLGVLQWLSEILLHPGIC